VDGNLKESIAELELLWRKNDLRKENDPTCRSYLDLFMTMREVYPGFDEREIVTILEFTL